MSTASMYAPALDRVRLEPFHASVELRLDQGDSGKGASVEAPAGQRLNIEFVAAEGFLPPGQKCLFSVIADGFGTVAGGADAGEVRVSQPVRIGAKPGSPVMLRVDRDGITGHARVRVSVFGHLRPLS
jgi:hypothetical protein